MLAGLDARPGPGRRRVLGAGNVPRAPSAVLAAGTIWAIWLVPDAFLRFILIMLAGTLYRLRVLGR